MKPRLRIMVLAVLFVLLISMIVACGGAAPQAEEEAAEPEQAAAAESTEPETASAYNEAPMLAEMVASGICRRSMSGCRQNRR